MKALVVGMGSIGTRHAQNLRELGVDVIVASRRSELASGHYATITEAMKDKPSHVIIATETSLHEESLREVLSFRPQAVLVEKPIFAFLPQSNFSTDSGSVFVAYNLRYHPVVMQLKKLLAGKKIISWSAYVGQDLPTWRTNRSYEKSYSAKKSLGGGVLRDLSHELDLLQFLAGPIEYIASAGGKFSSLDMDADDNYSLLLRTSQCPHAVVHMNCVDHIGQRFITINTDTDTFHADLIAGVIRSREGQKVIPIERNQSYVSMMSDFLSKQEQLCTFSEGMSLVELISKAEK